VYKEDNWGREVSSIREAIKKRDRRRDSWNGAAVRRGLDHGVGGIPSVRSRDQATSKDSE
jgi:hypothetical protein